ncbi:hypothetical protein ABLE93_12325 [Xanthobacter sp. KR7-65]|uniref:hypothetical protein n=1 Tax=Xanthobacter sp. KR7-65 TaxID=3156612 RepID=UPI0032B602C3
MSGLAGSDAVHPLGGLISSLRRARRHLHDKDDATVDPRFGRVGKQTIEDTGPLTQERMKMFEEEEVLPKAEAFMKKAKDVNRPFFIWLDVAPNFYPAVSSLWRWGLACSAV